jgi:flagellar hook protein FlgE
MGLSSAMNVGVTGLSTNSEAITVIGNNIANVNTVGFKEGRTLFSDVLSSNISNGQVGRGGQIQTVQNMFSQGSFDNTSSDFDLALQGEGMFVVQDASGQNYYTRAGAFDFNKDQVLANPDGYKVMGYGINQATGTSNGVLGAIDKTTVANLSAKATVGTNFVLNLNSSQSMPGTQQTSAMNLLGDFGAGAAPAATTQNIFDEFGTAHVATITWGGATPNYTYSIAIAGTQANTPGGAGAPITGTLSFPAITNPATQNILFSNGAKALPLSLNFSAMQNTAVAVAPSATQNGTAGQSTGSIALAGGQTTGATGTFVDSTGATHAMTINFPAAGTWNIDIAGATPAVSTISGTRTTGAAGSTWTQANTTVTINGIAQNVVVDLSQITSAASTPAISANGFDITNASSTSNFSNSIQVFDSQGNAHDLTTYYRKTGANTWEYHANSPDATSINGMAGNTMISGTLSFDANGILSTQTPAGATPYTFQFGGGVASQAVTIDFGAGISSQNASPSLVTTTKQDGYAAGSLTSTKIDDKGYVTGSYTNGQSQRIAQVSLARFASLGGLDKVGNSIFMATSKSGSAQIGTATDYNYKLFSKSLENSNVDMAAQLVNMIKLQRAYSGNSKTITTSDAMMQESLSLIR